jgi:hypothetical protein
MPLESGMTKYNRLLGLGGVTALAVAALAVQASHQLIIDGNTVSSNVIQSGDQYLVPVDDIAKALGYRVTTSAGNVTLTKNQAGSVNPMSNPYALGLGGNQTPQMTTGNLAIEGSPSQSPGESRAQTFGGASSALPTPAIPGTPITTATLNLFPQSQPSPFQISSHVGTATTVNGLEYTVEGFKTAGAKYKLVYDQKATLIHPNFKSDTLEVVDMTVANGGSKPVRAATPGASDVTVFDTNKIGYPASFLDIRQSSDAVGGDSSYDLESDSGTPNLILGPGGKLHFSVIASMPEGKTLSYVTISVHSGSPYGSSDTPANTAGTMITVKQ